ncbi:DNA topoisomerase I [Methanocaldococcus vulcanius M7]|uniref:DNA topoisomerase 1 n=1 Tax=Methanocaldococcus vulcanius (strain ATCC 700851 / DSM 12094 / M7) TaxID=579137 RepID=C9RG81_METVM|nr:DNA topoisomerase I [Methanocaldococcus vulcanius]ACX72583.1 DNA topoisomerase I [Methanocaldococcus vulcanius M7]
MTALIICEKPSVAKKIANALGKPKKKSIDGVPYYELERDGKKIIVASAVGHLFTLVENENNEFGKYPIFDIKWVPASVDKGKEYVNKYIKALKKLSKEADEFYIATDWDIEGELIGYHALKYCCGREKAKRMRFSSLTKKEIVKAFENPDEIDYGLVDAGESRHILDWYFGINLSRALMNAIRAVNRWKTMSVGRVQGPALAFLTERELEIKKFIPKPYWVIEALLKDNLKAIHEKEKFWDEKEAKSVYEKIKDEKSAKVVEIKKTKRRIKPLPPFDLGTLQREAYSYFKISPKETQEIAQRLYERALISYPRSSSQKLPKDRKYLEDILNIIKNHPIYGKWAEKILEKNLKPVEGKKDDPAHPAIHIVDIPKEELSEKEKKIYDLIARRTLSAFWDNAEREYLNVKIDIKGEKFKLSGSRTVKEGWHEIYYFPKFDEIELPPLKKNDIIKVEKITITRKETQPPKRYTVASIIKELEKRGLGTKCLTAKTLIKVKIDNEIKYMEIEKLFELLNEKYKEKNIELAVNNKDIKCFSFNYKDEVESSFKFISRRKLEKDESVYRIEFEDGSFIEATEEHPILIYDNGDFRYVKANDLKKGMKTISFTDNKDFITKTISNIRKINYNGYVYDIINSEYLNFIANNIVVHNSTRAEIIDKLIKRGYVVDDGSLKVTDLGISVIETLKRFCPEIVDEKMTRDLEEKLEKIQFRKIKKDEVLDEAENKLRKILEEFKEKEEDVGTYLIKNLDATNKKAKIVGKCPKCGGDLILIRHKKSRFVGCSNYPECDVNYSLPDKGRIKIPNKVCNACKSPILKIGDREICINPECPLKQVEIKEEDRICPKCGAELILKKGVYGAFYGCSNYPKCKYTEPINKKEKEIVGKCPKCGGDLVVREGKFGKFIGCSNYPKCKYTEKLKENEKKENKKGEDKT